MTESLPDDLGAARMRKVAALIGDRVLADLDTLVAEMGEAYRREIPEYAAMSQAQFVEEVLPISRRVVQTYFASLLDDRPVLPKELRPFDVSGRHRLDMGVPLESVLHAYRIAGRVTWSAVVAAVHPGEEAVLARMAARWMEVIDVTSSVVARAYVDASHERLRAVDARRRELVEAVLTANDAAEVAAVSLRFSTSLAARYTPVLIGGEGAASRIDEMLKAAPASTLGGHRGGLRGVDGQGGRVLLLVPDSLTPAAAATLRAACPDSLLAWGRPAAPGRELLDELHHVEQLTAAAVAGGQTKGSFGPEDLLLEQLLLRNERIAGLLHRRVAEVLASRDPSGSLADTLRHYLRTGSVPETAKAVIVHPNTVAYRLGKVREATGLDPRIPTEAALLVLGLGVTGREAGS